MIGVFYGMAVQRVASAPLHRFAPQRDQGLFSIQLVRFQLASFFQGRNTVID